MNNTFKMIIITFAIAVFLGIWLALCNMVKIERKNQEYRDNFVNLQIKNCLSKQGIPVKSIYNGELKDCILTK